MHFKINVLFVIAIVLFFVSNSIICYGDATEVRSVLADWKNWREQLNREAISLKIIRSDPSSKSPDLTYFVNLEPTKFYWSVKDKVSDRQRQDFSCGNSRYAFTLTNMGKKGLEVFDLRTRKNVDFLEFTENLKSNNILSMVLLLGNKPDNIFPLIEAADVVKSKVDDRNATIVFRTAKASPDWDLSDVMAKFEKTDKWRPESISWVSTSTKNKKISRVEYHFADWEITPKLTFPRNISTIDDRGNESFKSDYRLESKLSKEEQKAVSRFYLSDFGFPEPDTSFRIPSWMILTFVGAFFLVMAFVIQRFRKVRKT